MFDPGADANINSDLSALESRLRLRLSVDDPGANVATVANGQVVANPLTSGISSFVYGGFGISGVTGGLALFLEMDHKTAFVTVETRAVPEPASLVMVVSGTLGMLGSARRRRASRWAAAHL